ncbi:MAG: GntR family transcriptional regulator [Sphingobium sp.]|nr:MAG: GntR family transcriptional regulator [Sphingobium sp.]
MAGSGAEDAETRDDDGPPDGAQTRLYRDIARKLMDRINDGSYPVGGRLPAEREISAEFNVSRPTVREAIIALEVQGLVEVRLGSGAYVRRQAVSIEKPSFAVTGFELTEARLMFEGEAAALAATNISDDELDELSALIKRISVGDASAAEAADHEFHLLIARATRNVAIVQCIEALWALRQTSPDCVLLHARARSAKVKPVVKEHEAIIKALRTRDPASARRAMRAHLGAVIEHLLFATEEEAVERARREAQDTRARFTRSIVV